MTFLTPPRTWLRLLIALYLGMGLAEAIPPSAGASSKPRRRALVIGISKYRDPSQNLRSATNDVVKLTHFIQQNPRSFGPYQFTMLADHKAGRDRIQSALFDMTDWARTGDSVLFYFSGHSFMGEDGRTYLLPHDGDVNDLEGTGIELAKIFRMMRHTQASTKILWLDCCYSGRTETEGQSPLPVGITDKDLDVLEASPGTFILTSSAGREYSWEDPVSNLGFFTKHLIAGLKGEADEPEFGNEDDWVSARELATYVKRRVAWDARRTLEKEQKPHAGITSSQPVFLSYAPPFRDEEGSGPKDPWDLLRKGSHGATEAVTGVIGYVPALASGPPLPTLQLPGLAPAGRTPQGYPQYRSLKDESIMVHVPDVTPAGHAYAGNARMPREARKATGFLIDRYSVTNRQFALFVKETGHITTAEKAGYARLYRRGIGFTDQKGASWRHPLGPGVSFDSRLDHPVVCVSYDDCLAYLEWAGKRLPTVTEWEKAGYTSKKSRPFPWGTQAPGPQLANFAAGSHEHDWGRDGFFHTAPVDRFTLGASPFGVVQLVGNVWHWCQDEAPVTAGRFGPAWADRLPATVGHALRGGAWNSPVADLEFDATAGLHPEAFLNTVGFRGARSIESVTGGSPGR